jgi:hypothetical protein
VCTKTKGVDRPPTHLPICTGPRVQNLYLTSPLSTPPRQAGVITIFEGVLKTRQRQNTQITYSAADLHAWLDTLVSFRVFSFFFFSWCGASPASRPTSAQQK